MLCKQCGSPLEKYHHFCSQCGEKLESNQQLPMKATRRPSIRWLKAVLCLLLVGVASVLTFALLTSDITDTVSDQLAEIRQNRITEAYYNFTTKEFQKNTSLEHFREYLNRAPVFAQNQSIRFVDRHVDHDKGTLLAILKTKQGREIPVHYTLSREEGGWKVDNIQLQEPGKAALLPGKSGLSVPMLHTAVEAQ